MTDRDRRPEPDAGHVPDTVLDELTVAFSRPAEPPPKGYDFDDPSIDRLLGLPPAEHAAAGTDDLDDLDDPDDDEDGYLEADGDHDAEYDDEDDEYDDDEDDDEDDEYEEDDHQGDDGGPGGEGGQPTSAPRRTIVIAEDELPDTVYLDEEGEDRLRGGDGDATGARATVVIGDLDDGPAVHQLAPAGSASGGAMDPRIRARRIATRRAEGRRRLVWAGIVGAAILLVVGAIAVVASPIFDVTNVKVQGAVYTDADVLQEVIGTLKGHPVLLVDTRKAEARLREVPWVDRARVTASFPHTVTIDIRERRPVAAFQSGDGRFRVIDVEGRVLDVIAGQPDAYVLLTGNNPDTGRGQFAGAPFASAAGLVVALPPEIRSIVASIGVDATTSTLSMQLKTTTKRTIDVRLGDSSGLDDKLARLLSQVRKGLRGVCSLDVATPEVGVVPGC